jgi:putative aldouronate transport system substrate-binding protein
MRKAALLVIVTVIFSTSLFAGGRGQPSSPRAIRTDLITAPGEFPVVKEPVTVTMFISRGTNYVNMIDNRFTQWYEEKTGVHIEWVEATSDQAQKLNLMIQSGEYPEALLGAPLSMAQIVIYANQGLFTALNTYINDHSVHLKKIFDDYPYVRKGMADPQTGSVYALPYGSQDYEHQTPQKMWVYRPWLDKLGIKPPTNTEEFKQMLIAFRDRDPNGNGLKDEIPLSAAVTGWSDWSFSGLDSYLVDAFIYWDRITFLERHPDGKLSFNADTEGYRNAIRYIKSLYEENLFSDVVFTQSERDYRALGENIVPILGAAPAHYSGIFTVTNGESGRYLAYTHLGPLKGPDSKTHPFHRAFSLSPRLIVTDKAKNPEVFVRWADYFYSEEGTLQSYFGLKGIGWIDPPAGSQSFFGIPAIYERPTVSLASMAGASNILDYVWPNALSFRTRKIREGMYVTPENAKVNIDVLNMISEREIYDKGGFIDSNKALPNFAFNEADAQTLSQIAQPLRDYVRSNFADMVLGRKSVERDWDAYCAELKRLQKDQYLDIYQRAMTAWLKL